MKIKNIGTLSLTINSLETGAGITFEAGEVKDIDATTAKHLLGYKASDKNGGTVEFILEE